MKKSNLKVLALICLFGISLLWYACQKENNFAGSGEVSFTVSKNSALKSINNLLDADKVIIPVQYRMS